MAQPSFDAFFGAIAGQESGGNYKAVNARTGAAGKYQIMPANLSAWGKKYYGRPLTTSEFLASPRVQDDLARRVLSDYYNKYGARGAAAAWYSGSPKKQDQYTRFNKNEPSVGEYVDSVIKRAGGGGGAGSANAAEAPGNFAGSANAAEAPVRIAGQKKPTGVPAFTPPAPAVNSNMFVPTTVIDNTVKDSAIKQDQSSGGDVYAAQTATLAAGNRAAGIEAGTEAPSYDLIAQNAQGNAQRKQQLATLGATADEGSFNAAYGIGSGDTTGVRANIINLAKTYLGTPYKWGGTAPGGFDCSGLVQYVLGKNGITVPRVSYQQANSGARVGVDQAKAGDLIAWDENTRNNGADHIAIYLGNNQVLEAPHAGAQVRIRTLGKNEGAWGVSMNY